ncbi:MAG: glycosyltransferase family A protein [Candidatus Poribacteria bacterium]|nr:glycosyltransferase family A protein [Candidatus Poribacteria bacterium]
MTDVYKPRIGISIIARNEEEHIGDSIDSLLNQTIKPEVIVVCNDNSTDNTKQICIDKGVIVVDFPTHHKKSFLTSHGITTIVNTTLNELDKYELDYWMKSDADCIYPENYLERLISKMKVNNLVIACGAISGYMNGSVTDPGRIYDYIWWNQSIKRYPEKSESSWYIVLKAKLEKKNVGVYSDIQFKITRPWGTNYTWKTYLRNGRDAKYIGCIFPYVLLISWRLKNPLHMMAMIAGYILEKGSYEEEIIQMVRNEQKRRFSLKRILKKIRSSIRG